MRSTRLAWGIGFVAGFSFFLFGYDQGDFAGLLTVESFRTSFPEVDTIGLPDNGHVAIIQGVTVGAWNIACFLSAILTIFWGDIVGRKNTILIGFTFLIIGEVIQASSFSFGQLIAGRVVAGFGNGFTTATVPAWQAECTKAHRRGTLLMISSGACIAAGLSFSYWMSFAFSWLASSAAWRVPIGIQLIFALITIVTLVFLPESPRWLILTGREEKALRTLAALNDLDVGHEQVRSEYLAIKDAVIEMAKADFSSTFIMGDYRHLHRVVLAFVLQIFQQITGINLIMQYLPLMLIQQYRFTPWLARLLAACAGTEFFLASFVAVVGIDRFWGRRSLMLFGATGMSLSMIVLCIMAYLGSQTSAIVGTIFLFVFVTFFAIGWQGMSWLYAVEVVPLRIRGPANAISTACNWLVNYAVVLAAPIMFNRIGYRTYIVFAVTNFVIIPVVYFLYPETGYRSLEEVDVIFHNASLSPNPWLDVRKIADREPLWYGRHGEIEFDYEQSPWHQRHVTDSPPSEMKGSSGSEDRTLTMSTSGAASKSVSPLASPPEGALQFSDPSSDTVEDDACPAPIVPRVSHDFIFREH